MVGWRMTNNGRSAGLHAPSGPAEQEVPEIQTNAIIGEIS
jgi:hypothetical protein